MSTYTPWDEQAPGFVELDLVAHCGDSASGEFLYTLNTVDIATGWTECEPIANKGQIAVVAALGAIRARLPFPLLGIDSDNGSEFINAHLLRYCQTGQISFTRCRAYHKNDQAHIEQKNYTAVRQLVGYDRYEGEEALEQLRRVYALARLHSNGWLPVMKLIGKQREGAKVSKSYDKPQPPMERAISAGVVGPEARTALEAALGEQGPKSLKRRLDAEIE
ncbi:MAG: transposase family protein, partial [Chloroflexia bacterium]